MSASHADLENRISEIIAGWIPGDGITEVGVELNDADNDNINFSILGVRSIEKSDDSNFFTQFSLRNEEKNSSGRLTGNLGFGLRELSEDQSFMYGANFF